FDWQLVAIPYWIPTICAIGIFAISASSTRAPARAIIRSLPEDMWSFVGRAPTWIAATAFVCSFSAQPAAPTPSNAMPTVSAFELWFASQEPASVSMPAGVAKVLIVKVNDYQCPPCKKGQMDYTPIVERLASEYPAAIKFVMIDYPLETECNPY